MFVYYKGGIAQRIPPIVGICSKKLNRQDAKKNDDLKSVQICAICGY